MDIGTTGCFGPSYGELFVIYSLLAVVTWLVVREGAHLLVELSAWRCDLTGASGSYRGPG